VSPNPEVALLDMTKSLAARYPERPRTEDLRIVQSSQLANDDDHDILQEIVRVRTPDQDRQILA
jgi:hypothetical protein